MTALVLPATDAYDEDNLDEHAFDIGKVLTLASSTVTTKSCSTVLGVPWLAYWVRDQELSLLRSDV